MDTPNAPSLDDLPVGCLVTDPARRIRYSNQYMIMQLGDAPQGRDLFELFSKASQVLLEAFVFPTLARDGRCDEIRLTLVAASGEARPVMVSAVSERGGARYLWSIHDAQRTEQLFGELKKTQRLLEQKLSILRSFSHIDPLTELPNRAALSECLNQRIIDHPPGGRGFALALIDLDGFKAVNDAHGHEVGDQVLCRIARRLLGWLGQRDLVARFGGDEFVLVLDGDGAGRIERTRLSRLLERLEEPFVFEDVTITLSASLGVTFYPQTRALEPDQLVRQADQAMYQAKLAGKNQVHFFDVDDEDVQKKRHATLAAIEQAMAAGEFELFYQPKVNMRTGEVLGAEALIRWNHPTRGVIGPGEFLPVVTKTLCGVRLGRWVITTALEQLRAWHRQGVAVAVSVNVDGYHLQHPQFLQDLTALLKRFAEIPRPCLELEVLETSAIEDVGQAALVISACREMGLKVSLDDFGTGYSSLSQLRDLPVDTLKIDRSFVQNMFEHRGDLAILKGVIGFASAFECDLIAEGVETRQHYQALLALGCEQGQGYYIARPMPAAAFPAWRREWARDELHKQYDS